MKRIWKTVTAEPASIGWHVLLDSKPIKKPGGAGLDGGEIKPDDLPLTRLATTAIDRIPAHRPDIIGQLAAYGAAGQIMSGPKKLLNSLFGK